MKKMTLVKSFLLSLAVISLCSCVKKTPAEKASLKQKVEGGSIVIGFATEMNNFDPFDSLTADTRSLNFNIFEGLVKVGTDGDFIPAVARSYEASSDSLSYIFILRDGVVFHDGKPVGMEDVLYSIQKAIDKDMSGYSKIKDFSAVSEKELVINLKSADAGFVAYLTTPIVEKDAQNLALKPIGTGPYMFTDYVEQDHITLSKNKNYWGLQGHLDTITIKFATSQSNLILDFQSGSIDSFTSNADSVEQLNKDEYTIYQRNSNSVQLLALNNKVKPFDDIRVRKALCYLVDPQEIIQAVNYGYGVQVSSALIPSLSKYYDSALNGIYNVDDNKAKILLAQAGYDNNLSFTITVPSNYTVHVKTAEVIVNQLAKAGIKVQIKQVDWPTWLQTVYTDRQYETTIISVDGALAYPTSYLSRYCSTAHNNFVNFVSDEYDQTYAKAVTTTNDEDRVTLFKQAQRVLTTEAASVFIQDISSLTVYNSKFAGNKDYPLYAIDLSAIYRIE